MVTSLFVVACGNSMVVSYRPIEHGSTVVVDIVAWILGGLVLNFAVLSNLRTAPGGPAPSVAKRLFFSLVALCIVGLMGLTWTLGPLLTASCTFDFKLVGLIAAVAMGVFAAQSVLFQLLGNRRLRGVLALVVSSAVLVGVMTIAKEEIAFPMLCPPKRAAPYQFDNHGY